ncbi:MAG: T9SS type A sorting domain-containing protein [Bacteroidales bacterium]
MKKLIIIILWGFLPCTLWAQWQERALVSSGGYQGSLAGFTVEFSIGEIAIGYWQNGDYHILAGFHQPPAGAGTNTENLTQLQNIRVWPNPTRSSIYIDFQNINVSDLKSVIITDMRGIIVMEFGHWEIHSNPMQVWLKDLHPGIYFIRFVSQDGQYRVLKVSLIA